MNRLVAVLSGLLVLPAFAEVAPIFYDEVIEYSDMDVDATEDVVIDETDINAAAAPVVQPSKVNPRLGNASSGRVASRVVPSTQGASTTTRNAAAGRVTATTRATTTGAATTRSAVAQNASTRGTVSRNATRARAATNGATQIATTRRAMQSSTPSVTARAAANASIVQTDTVNKPLYTGRVSTRSSAVRARIPTITSVGATSATVAESAEATTQSMDELAQITDFCKAQYTQCMDNFCNVLDDNQGRCSCSKNIKNYAKTEEALKEATEALQDVAQQIQYIGLSSDEIETLFSQTEAELQMQKSSDNSQLKHDLDKIKNLIVEVKSGTATSTETGLSFDLSGLLDFSIDSTGFDLSALFGNQTNTSSISNQRGEQLYKTATSRCKAAVLTDCQAQGVDISIITNSYDLEIDKQCIAYERSLTDTNEEMSQTVRNAKSVLQRARLLVAQQKNAYDLRGCINALDSCMQDEFVCGSDYENCLDPTGKYIVNSEIVVGSTPGQAISENMSGGYTYSTKNLYATWNYNKIDKGVCTDSSCNAWNDTSTKGTLTDYINATVDTTPVAVPSDNMSEFLQYKIGYYDKTANKNYGMCMSVLNKCQDITYTGETNDKTYNPANNVVREYLQRTLTQIKTMQDEIVADYAENCISDVSACLAQNNYSESRVNIAINACKQQIVTCMSVNGDADAEPSPAAMKQWVADIVKGTDLDYFSNSGTSGDSGNITTPVKPLTETEVCLSNGDAVISQNKKYCIVYGVKTEEECIDVMKKSGGKLHFSMPYNHVKQSAVTGTVFEPSICFYMLPSVYDSYKQTCVRRYAGTFDEYVPVDTAQCEGITVASEQACTNIGGTIGRLIDGKPDLSSCYYRIASVLDGDIYTAKDLRATSCLDGMEVVDEETGNCKCKQGYEYETAYNCVPTAE